MDKCHYCDSRYHPMPVYIKAPAAFGEPVRCIYVCHHRDLTPTR